MTEQLSIANVTWLSAEFSFFVRAVNQLSLFFPFWKVLPIISSNTVSLTHRTFLLVFKTFTFYDSVFWEQYSPKYLQILHHQIASALSINFMILKSSSLTILSQISFFSITFLPYYFLHSIKYLYISHTRLFIYHPYFPKI